MTPRPTSPTRRAFAAAAEGKHVPIAIGAIAMADEVTGPKKLGRMLSGDGDLNPPWPVLDEILDMDPATVLAMLSERYGFQPPVRKPQDLAALADKLLEIANTREAENERFGEVLDRLAEVLKPKPAMRAVRPERGRARTG